MALLVELQPVAMRQRVAALHLGEVAHVVGRQGGDVARCLACRLVVGHAARGRRAQQADIDVVQLRRVDRRPRLVAHLDLLLAEEVGELLDLRLHRLVDLGSWDRTAAPPTLKSRSCLLLRARQGELPAAAVDLVGPGHHVHGDLEILGAARQRADHGDVGLGDAAVQRMALAATPRPRSACGRTRRSSAPDCGSRRRCRCPPRCRSGRRPAPRPSRPTSRPACATGPRDCWSCRRPRCSSASRRGSAARWSCRTG